MLLTYPALGWIGRLGNQMWQVASTVGLARSQGYEPAFPTDWPYRPWFSLPTEWYSDAPGTPATDLVAHLCPTAQPYLQDLSLWAPVADEVRAAFAPSEQARDVLDTCVEFRALRHPILSVHVRRGDNAFDPNTPDKWRYHPLRPLRYYQQAIAELSPKAATVAVFGDDPTWNRAWLPADLYGIGRPRPKEHEETYNTAPVWDWVDLYLMAECQLHVISNSTFAFWGAWLSGDPSPVYPWPWYGDALAELDASLMFPTTWTRLDHGPYVPGED